MSLRDQLALAARLRMRADDLRRERAACRRTHGDAECAECSERWATEERLRRRAASLCVPRINLFDGGE